MSWSICLIGSPANVAKALDEQSVRETGQCKIEFDAALPHMKALVLENFQTMGEPYCQPIIHLEASGHGSASGPLDDLKQIDRNCTVSIKAQYGKLV